MFFELCGSFFRISAVRQPTDYRPTLRSRSRFIDAFMTTTCCTSKKKNQKGHRDADDINRAGFSVQSRGFKAVQDINNQYCPDECPSFGDNHNHTNHRQRP